MHKDVGDAELVVHAANAPSLLLQTQPRRAGTSDKIPAQVPKSWVCKALPCTHSLPGRSLPLLRALYTCMCTGTYVLSPQQAKSYKRAAQVGGNTILQAGACL